jgi:phosphatidylinositol glycan class V
MLWLLLQSSVTVLRSYNQPPLRGRLVAPNSVTMKSRNVSFMLQDVPELAVPQLVLAMTATTSFHVQIVNRIASGYPTWYLMVANWFVEEISLSGDAAPRQRSQWILRGMTLYALVQGMLFANFLPPA